jgi:AhpD family alkylhydroperoxidase
VYAGFGALSKAAFANGTLDGRTKELIALAIGVVQGCDGCIASHSQAAARAGATRQEAAEAIGVAFLMHGGPATIHGARAFEVFCEFAEMLDAAGPMSPH